MLSPLTFGGTPKPSSPRRSHSLDQSSPTPPGVQPLDLVSSSRAQETHPVRDLLGRIFKGARWVELQQINRLRKQLEQVRTPEQFQAQTRILKNRLQNGESFEDIRVEAYGLAARASEVATGMNPYDSQVMGAQAMSSGEIAEMMTGEGKTLTAVMPLYLHALAGKGAHLVTVNDTLAKRDAEDMGPIFKLLGLSVGTVLEGMTPEEKRDGYAADVTYTTDRTLGFDFLRDRTAKSPEQRVQREPFFALVDEVDEVLLDEARTPLIISGKGEAPSQDYQKFDKIVSKLKPGIDFFVNREQGTAWLSDLGLEFVENELYGQEISRKDPQSLAQYHRKAGALRAEGKAYRALLAHDRDKPDFFSGLFDEAWSEEQDRLQRQYRQASTRTDAFPDPYNLYSAEHEGQVRFLNASLKAHALFEEGVDYIVQDQQVKIVDENKGRTSKGRRFNQGLHQALEAKSGVPLRPESQPLASITYPKLFAKYPHLAGMSGTAKSAEAEFQKLYGLKVTEVPTNLQFQANPSDPEDAPRHNRIDEPDVIFSSKREKFAAVVSEALKAYEEGIPVLLGTLSVEANHYLHQQLLAHGVNPGALQVLNAEHVRGDKSLENSIIAQAGRSGMITVATNMAGRGVNIKPDLVNYKKLAMAVEQKAGAQNKPLVVDVADKKEAGKLAAWLEGRFPYSIDGQSPRPGETLIRVAGETPLPDGVESLKASDFPTGGLYVIGTERSKSRRIDDQLIGRAARQGQPGRSKFFLSLEDDLVHELAKHELDAGLEVVTGGAVESKFVNGLVEQAQSRLAEMDLHAREQTNLYDEVLDTQRETFYEMRDGVLNPETDLRYKLIEDSKDVVLGKVLERLPGSGKHSPEAISAAVNEVAKEMKLEMEWKGGAAKEKEIAELVRSQVEADLTIALREFDKSEVAVDELYRQSLLGHFDQAWSDHLEGMSHLKQGVQWSGAVGEKPEDVYKKRGFELFSGTMDAIQNNSIVDNLPQILAGADILKRDRELARAS